MELRLANRVGLVTGAGNGIGRAIALALAAQGARVTVTDINQESAMGVAREVRDRGGAAQARTLDVTSKAEAVAAIDGTVAEWGRLDILCNNAGVSTMNWALHLTEEEWDANMDVNVKGVFLVSQAALPQMIQQGSGRIINTASMAGKRAAPLLAHYTASKFAVIGFTKALALEVARYGITVNAVCPGYVRTSMQDREVMWESELRGLTPHEVVAEYVNKTPLGRLEEPEDVARLVAFLASDEALFITGAAMDITGGADLV